ncbi:uncharacterized protein LOC131316093 [Rhododendron vialii]|uniref:uncharacterized protein LOC131316093 n=1 Tax=Rhododendron vialii TaxID=182163 RepID=UPI00265FF87A|nr:uncharacterized protein LOC131316093 [Rhododendron vialii]
METDDEGEIEMEDEGGSSGPPVRKIEVESGGSRLTREEKGKALVIEEEPAVVVPIFDRLADDLGVESTWQVSFLDYEEFVEDEDVLEAKMEEPGIAAMVFEARVREVEREELLRSLEPEGDEVLREFEREAAEAEVVPRVSVMQEAQKAARVDFNAVTYAPRAHFFVPQLLDPYKPT